MQPNDNNSHPLKTKPVGLLGWENAYCKYALFSCSLKPIKYRLTEMRTGSI